MKRGRISVNVPHRISGFFEIVDKISEEPEKIGSRGAGFNLNAVGITEIHVRELEDDNRSKCIIRINQEELNERAETSFFIFNSIKKMIKTPIEIHVNHSFELPVGCGYGASGSGALGMIYGLNEILDLNLNNKEKGRIAHVAEVVNRTGLGTVCGQLAGGLCMLMEPGYPCVHENISYPKDIVVICGSFGMIHTKSILTDPELNAKIKQAGKKALEKLIQAPSLKMFARVSIEFVKETNILEILHLTKINEILDRLNKLNIIGASMNQLGRSVFAICEKKESSKVMEILETYTPEITLIKTSINNKGPRIIDDEPENR